MEVFNKPLEWQKFLKEGRQFLSLAERGARRPEKFNTETLYNVLAMSVEKNFMAFFLSRNVLPEGHTLQDMLSAAAALTPLGARLVDGLLFMDGFQEICSVDGFTRKLPTEAEITRMVDIAMDLQNHIEKELAH